MKTQIFDAKSATQDIILTAAQTLKTGGVIVMPTDTVYGIVANALDANAVQKMCEAKQKPLNVPLQYLAKDLDAVKEIAFLPLAAEKLARAFWPGPLTMTLPPLGPGGALLRGFDTLGIRVPDHAFTRKILASFGGVLAASSANLHGAAAVNSDKELIEIFDGRVDIIFTAGALPGTASTVLNPDPLVIYRHGVIKEAQIRQILL